MCAPSHHSASQRKPDGSIAVPQPRAAVGVPDWSRHELAGVGVPAQRAAMRGRLLRRKHAARTARGDSLWLFGLDGTLDAAVASGTAMQFTQGAAGPANLDNGKATYERACASCHGPQGEGGHDGAPGLRAVRSAALVMQTVSEGRREMPSFSSLLTAEQIRDVAGYVSQRLAHP